MAKIIQLADHRRGPASNTADLKTAARSAAAVAVVKALGARIGKSSLTALHWSLFVAVCALSGPISLLARVALFVLVPVSLFSWCFKPGLSVTWALTACVVFAAVVPVLWHFLMGFLQPKAKAN